MILFMQDSELSIQRAHSESSLKTCAKVPVIKKLREMMHSKEVLSKVVKVRNYAKVELQRRGILRSNLVFGSNIPTIVKVGEQNKFF